MIVLGIRVGMPTSKNMFSLIADTIGRLLNHALDSGLGCVWELADKLEWVMTVTMHSLEHQPLAQCYAARFGMDRLAALVRRAELCALAALLKRYHESHWESEEEHIARMVNLDPDPKTDRRVYH